MHTELFARLSLKETHGAASSAVRKAIKEAGSLYAAAKILGIGYETLRRAIARFAIRTDDLNIRTGARAKKKA